MLLFFGKCPIYMSLVQLSIVFLDLYLQNGRSSLNNLCIIPLKTIDVTSVFSQSNIIYYLEQNL